MANKKISGFDDLRKTPLNTGDADVTYVAGFAAFGTNDNNTANVNVQLSGAELIVSLQKKLDLSQFETGILPALRGGTGLNSISTLLNANVNYSTDGTGVLPVAKWLPTGGVINQYIDFQGNWQTISTGTTYQAGDGLEIDTTTTPDTIKADLKANGGIVFESSELAIDLGASSITGTLKILDGGTGLSSVGTTGQSIRINSTNSGFEYYTPTDDNTTYTLENLVNSNLINLKSSIPSSEGTVEFTAGTGITLDNSTAGTIEITNSSPNNPDAYNLIPATGNNPNLELKKNSTIAAGTVNFTGGSNITINGGVLPGTITISATDVGDVYDLRLQSNSSDPNLFLRAGNPPVTQDTINLKAGSNMSVESDASGIVTFDAANDNTTYTYTANGTADPDLRLSDGTTDQDIQLVGGTNVNINNSGNIITIDSTGGGGGDSVQTLTSTAWNFTLGNSAIFTPTDNDTNPIDILVASNFPAGARGSLKIIPTNTIKFGLFTNSKLPSSQNILQVSAVNPTILHYFYDGTTFYWFYDVNYIDPINQSPDPGEPTVGGSNLLGFWFPGSTSFADGANISLGDTWTQSLPSPGPGLIGNLTRVGSSSGSNGMRYFARDEVAQEAPYWDFIGDVAWESTVSTPGGGSSIDDWGISFYFKATSNTSTTSYMGIADPNTNDAEAIYLNSRLLTIYKGSTYVNIQGNFPKFTSANNLQDEWVFCHIDVLQGANIVNCFIGTQASFNASTSQGGSGTITGEDGNPITLEASGLFSSVTAVSNLNDSGMSTIIYGAAKSGSGTVFEYEGHLGLVAFYNGQLLGSQVTNNWNDTREFYYIN